MPLLSVILPTFNRGHVISRAIESVLVQTLSDFELVIVDDGSTDGTRHLLAAIEDPRVRVIRSDFNRGGNWARNRGIEHARSDLVSFIDSDDAYLPEKIECAVEFFSKHQAVDVWVDSFVSRDDQDRGKPDKKKVNPLAFTGAAFRAGLFERKISKATAALNIRKSALFDVGLFDETLCRRQDFDLILRLSKRHHCMTTDRILWMKYETSDGISRNADTFMNAAIAISERHPDYLRDHPEALYRDLRSHFSKLLKQQEWKTLVVDARRYRRYEPFEVPFWRLLLDGRVSERDPKRFPESLGQSLFDLLQDESAQRSRNESGTPSIVTGVSVSFLAVQKLSCVRHRE